MVCYLDGAHMGSWLVRSVRRNRGNFRKGKVENDKPLPRLLGAEMRTPVMRLPIIPFGKNDKKINGFGESHNWVRTSIFWELPYWSTNLIRHNLDVMHVEKNVFDNVYNTVMNVTGKTKDMIRHWRDEDWLKKGKTTSSNRAEGGEKAKGTYKGGSISQLQHIVKKSHGPINWVDMYVKTRGGLSEPATMASSQSSSQPSVHTPADCVKAICQDPELLRILGGHLGALDPEELARAVAEVNASQQGDGSEGAHRDDHDDEFGGSS
ncbi:hypothetical protein AgCh_027940 [Apium graveolens]